MCTGSFPRGHGCPLARAVARTCCRRASCRGREVMGRLVLHLQRLVLEGSSWFQSGAGRRLGVRGPALEGSVPTHHAASRLIAPASLSSGKGLAARRLVEDLKTTAAAGLLVDSPRQ